ncbi:YMGG-like glycine zipper-containing protein [Alsobacter sp. SYSU M60028]|uniref:YMGG-like glycine zipper-containing protein n=1 Tax=Alsobacter ponti TaxID=2962936 RepID=A0ABT1L9T3_9HYPH|nr:YMGG-like glycine zipper-containing protein [Alsobacter ponti]MCP8938224.1 YMGG-like glycine zipper-containing protein [Alsobacter ponti]
MRWIVVAVALTALAGCNTESQSQRTVGGAAIGAGTGALIGAAAGGGRGAAVGAIAGGAAGALIGRATTPNNCVFQDRNGRRFTGPCP